MFNSILKSGAVYLLIGVLPIAANFIIAPIFTRYLTREEYGILAIAAVTQAYLSVFLDLGLMGAFSRIYFQFHTNPKLSKGLYSTVLLTVLIISLFIGSLFYFNGQWIFESIFTNSQTFTFTRYGWIIWSSALLIIIQTLTLSLYRNSENIKAYSLVAAGSFFFMTAGSIVGVVLLKLGAYGSLLGKLIGIAIIIVPYTFFYFSKHPPIIRLKFLKPIFSFAIPLVPYALIGLVMDNMDKQFAEYYLGLNKLGLYNVAFLIASVPAILLFASQSTINPQVYKLLEEYKISKNDDKLRQVSNLFEGFLLFMVLIIAGVVAVVAPLTSFYLGSDYQEIVYFVPIIVLAFIPRSLFVVYIIPILFDRKTKFLPYINGTAVIGGGALGFYIVPEFGLIGLSFLLLSIKSIQLLAALIVIRKTMWFVGGIFNLNKSIILFVLALLLIVLSQLLINTINHRFIVNTIPLVILSLIALYFYQEQFKRMYSKIKSHYFNF